MKGMTKLLATVLTALLILPSAAFAGDNNPKITGFLQTGWNGTSNEVEKTNTFEAKRMRIFLTGNAGDKIDYLFRVEFFNNVSGTTFGNRQKTMRLTDAFATWTISPAFKLRFGQFYSPLGYESYDLAPTNLETIDFTYLVYRISARNPFEYNFTDTGHDLGVMAMGDLFDTGEGFHRLTYFVALTNGSLPAKDDSNLAKDIYVSLDFRPVKHLSIKGNFGYGKGKTMNFEGGTGLGSGDNNPHTRYILGAWYDNPEGFVFRTEYGNIFSQINGIDLVDEHGLYALAGYHCGKFLPVIRWDMFEDIINPDTDSNFHRFLAGCTYEASKHVKIQVNYNHRILSETAAATLGYKNAHQLQIMGLLSF